jgi:hypothetical protein
LIREYDEENQTIDCIITIDAIRTQILNSQSVHLEWDDGGERYGDIPGTLECWYDGYIDYDHNRNEELLEVKCGSVNAEFS